jgi:hypothetical protein
MKHRNPSKLKTSKINGFAEKMALYIAGHVGHVFRFLPV